MYAIEFEADIQGGSVKIPAQYSRLENSHVRVVLMLSDGQLETVLAAGAAPLEFADCDLEVFKGRDIIDVQKDIRGEW